MLTADSAPCSLSTHAAL